MPPKRIYAFLFVPSMKCFLDSADFGIRVKSMQGLIGDSQWSRGLAFPRGFAENTQCGSPSTQGLIQAWVGLGN